MWKCENVGMWEMKSSFYQYAPSSTTLNCFENGFVPSKGKIKKRIRLAKGACRFLTYQLSFEPSGKRRGSALPFARF